MKPERVERYYAAHEWMPQKTEQSPGWHVWVERTRLIRLSAIFLAVQAPAEVLELGCGTGDILATLREHGYRVYGIEIDRVPARHAAKLLGSDCFSSEPIERYPDSERFDAVAMFHVLEHTPHPLAFMNEVNRVLKTGGKVIISIPNLTFLRIRQVLGRAVDWQAPGHLHFFSQKTLSRLLELSGFRLLYPFWTASPFIPGSRGALLRVRVALSGLAYRAIWEASRRRLNLVESLDFVAEKISPPSSLDKAQVGAFSL